MPPENQSLKCSLHDWYGLRSQLLFVSDGLVGNTNGAYVRHNELSAWLVREGAAALKADGHERTARAGQWLICNGQKIRQELSPDAVLLSVRVRNHWPEGTALFSGGPLCLFDAADHPELEVIARKMVDDMGQVQWGAWERSYAFLWENRINFDAYMGQQANLHLWLRQLGEVLVGRGWKLDIPAAVDARLAQALFVIDNQYVDAPYFPVKEMEKASGLSIRKLTRIFEISSGMTLHAYWEKRRVDRARQSLEQGGMNVKEIAFGLGFSQLSHFSAWFKRHTGMAPRSYREEFGRKNPE